MTDGLVHLKRHLLAVDDERRRARGTVRRREERDRLLADTRRVACEVHRLEVLVARLLRVAAV